MPTSLLIIDDEVAFLEVLGDACRDQGYRVSTATTVDQGVDVAIAVQPTLIVLDVTFPDGRGWHTLETLGTHPRTRNIPVIMMTGNPISRPAPCRVTPAAWLDKPFTPAQLFDTIDKVLGTGRAAAQQK